MATVTICSDFGAQKNKVIVTKKYLRDTIIHSLYMQYYVGYISAVD